jgi:hypothetical protein
MQANHAKYGQTTTAGADTKLLGALDIFRQRVDHSVENTARTNKKFSEKIKVMVAKAAETGLLEVMLLCNHTDSIKYNHNSTVKCHCT